MTEVLGHERYGIQGGDWGAIIGSRLAQLHPEAVVGLHTNYPLSAGDIDPAWSADATPLEREHLAHLAAVRRDGARLQRHPVHEAADAGAGAADSPAGLAAWILEKFETWSDGGLAAFSRDDLLTNLMFYWAPNSAASSAAMYFESRLDPEGRAHPMPDVPVGVASFPREIRGSRALGRGEVSRRPLDRDAPGGHFAALEQPTLLADDVRGFFASLR